MKNEVITDRCRFVSIEKVSDTSAIRQRVITFVKSSASLYLDTCNISRPFENLVKSTGTKAQPKLQQCHQVCGENKLSA